MYYRRVRVAGASYFFTVVLHRRQEVFHDACAVEAFNAAIETVSARRPFDLAAQVILPDHIHALWTLPEADDDYPTRWRLIKEGFTRWHVAKFGETLRSKARSERGEQAVWQRRYWEHTIRNEEDFERHMDYIHFNPVKHLLAATPKDWPHSTFLDWVSKGRYDINWGSDRKDEIAAWRRRE